MNDTSDITFNGQEYVISGDIRYANVMSLYAKSLPLLTLTQHLTLDFSQLHSSDSSGIAVIIEWIKFAKATRKTIQIKNLSQALLPLVKAAGLDALIS